MMGGEFKEENKPDPWELSPYELGREYAYHHRVSGKTAAWIVAYCVALIWAVLEGASAPPRIVSMRRTRGRSSRTPWSSRDPPPPRGRVLVFHILARRVWSGDDHDDPTKEGLAPARAMAAGRA